MSVKRPAKSADDHWWNELSEEEQKDYLHRHPHSHKRESHTEGEGKDQIEIYDDYSPNITKTFNKFNHDTKWVPAYLDHHLTDEEKEDLQDIVEGHSDYSHKVATTLKKVLVCCFTGAALGATVGLVGAPLVLACWAAMKASVGDPAKWLYEKIHNIGGDEYKAVEDTLSDSFDFKSVNDDALNDEIEDI